MKRGGHPFFICGFEYIFDFIIFSLCKRELLFKVTLEFIDQRELLFKVTLEFIEKPFDFLSLFYIIIFYLIDSIYFSFNRF
ncbi:hypothetical protein C2855_15895 [Aeromonas bestiarum]|nr:hypothetical protein C2855_15895 [Aeromonas bestiarum]